MDESDLDHPPRGAFCPLTDAAFPKGCRTCGAVYASADEFMRRTRPPAGGRSIKAVSDAGVRFLELYRNCGCGSTLMDFFAERRDASDAGDARRQRWVALLRCLQQQGLPPERCRAELRRLLLDQAPPDPSRPG